MFRRGTRRASRRSAEIRRSSVDRLEPRMLLAGDVDPTFGIQVTTDFGLRGDVALDVAQQTDGKLVVVGYSRGDDRTDSDLALARYNADGSLDASFGQGIATNGPVKVTGGGGRVTLSYNDPVERHRGEAGHHLEIQGDKLVVSASIDGMITLVRFNADGSLDTTFDGDGLAQMSDQSTPSTVIDEDRTDLVVLSDGYLLSGTQLFPTPEPGRPNKTSDMNWVLVRFDSNGQLVPTFGTGGRVVTDFQGAGFTDSNGDPVIDPRTGTVRSWDETSRVEVLPDGDILQAGGIEVLRDTPRFRNALAFVRFNPDDGSVDTAFGGTRYFRSFERTVTSGPGQAGKTIIEFLQKPDTPEPDVFGTKPFVNVTGLTLAPDGGILATGVEMYRTFIGAPDKNASRILVYRLNSGGDLDAGFAGDGIYEGLEVRGRNNQLDAPTSILMGPGGKILVVGKSGEGQIVSAPGDFLVLQLNPDGTPDTSAGDEGARRLGGGATIGRFNGALIDGSGRLVAVGQSGQGVDRGKGIGFEPIDSDFVVSRFNADGSVDGSFGNDHSVVPEMTVLATAVDAGGMVLTAGYRGSAADGTARAVVARYTAVGEPDRDFAPVSSENGGTVGMAADAFATGNAATFSAVAHAVAPAADGSVYVTGVSGTQLAVARFTPAGTFDADFDGDGVRLLDLGAAGGVDAGYGLAVLPGGDVVVAGESDGRWLLLRLNPNGSPDGSFGDGGVVLVERAGADDAAVTVLPVAGGKLLVSGTRRVGADRAITLMRFNADGSVDNTFAGGAGLVTGLTTARLGVDDDPFNRLDAQGVAVDAAGRIVVAGASGDDAGVARYTADGGADAAFGTAGRATFDWGGTDDPDSIAFGDGGQILITGTVQGASEAMTGTVVAAVTPDGNRRAGFGDNGVLRLESQATEGLGRTFRSGGTTRSTRSSIQGGSLVVASRKEVGNAGRSTVRRIVALDDQGPAATLTPVPQVFVPDGTTQSFEVVYSDDVAIDFTTIDTADVTVTGPGGAIPISQVQITNPSNGSPRSAIYTVAAPGGAFDSADNGTYSIALVPGAVADTSGNAAAGGALGVFVVDIKPVNLVDGPNFVLTFARGFSGSFVGGAKGKAAASVTNNGLGPAVATNVVLYLSADTVVDGTDRPLATGQIRKALQVGKRASVKFARFNFPSDLPAGPYHVLARVDDGNANTENVEIDNVFDGGTIALAPPIMDAVPVSLSSLKVKAGRGSVSLLVRNDGNVPIKGIITGTLFASADGVLDGADTSLGTYSVRGSIKPGATKRLKVRFTPPAGLSGTFSLIATAVAPGDPTPDQNAVLGGLVLP